MKLNLFIFTLLTSLVSMAEENYTVKDCTANPAYEAMIEIRAGDIFVYTSSADVVILPNETGVLVDHPRLSITHESDKVRILKAGQEYRFTVGPNPSWGDYNVTSETGKSYHMYADYAFKVDDFARGSTLRGFKIFRNGREIRTTDIPVRENCTETSYEVEPVRSHQNNDQLMANPVEI